MLCPLGQAFGSYVYFNVTICRPLPEVVMLIVIVVFLFCILCSLVFIGSELRAISHGIALLLDRFGVPRVN